MLISIVMPCLNEEATVEKVMDEIPLDELKEKGYEVEVLFVDGGSCDRSVDLAQKSGAKILRSEAGYGRQYRFGFEHAKGDIIVAADSDATYPLSDIPLILEELTAGGFDFVTLNRFSALSPGSMSLINRIGNIFLTRVTNLLFHLDLKDSQSGMWAFRREALKRMTLTSSGMSFSEEIKIEAFRRVKALEIPGSYRQRKGPSKLKRFRHGWGNLFFLIRKWRGTGRWKPS